MAHMGSGKSDCLPLDRLKRSGSLKAATCLAEVLHGKGKDWESPGWAVRPPSSIIGHKGL